ncbi:MAG: cell division cycle- protein [Bogoriella megaspora]|nr:MAG: cell division cycle- protein [Bogoriella megaspora]
MLERATTPPIQSSSPGYAPESMDISPLPHKVPFSLITEVAVASPSPEATPTDEDMLSPGEPISQPQPEALKPLQPSERKKNLNIRPGLARTKGYSTNSVSLKTIGTENQLPTFKFGNGLLGCAHKQPSLPTLAECFTHSPAAERKVFEESLMPPPSRPRQPSLSSRASGSPITGHVRKPSTGVARPRKQFRRSMSMFEHPGDVIDDKKDDYIAPTTLQSVMDVDNVHTLKLPSFIPEDEPDGLPRITKDTMVKVLDRQYSHLYEKTLIIDCRFEYEYKGGHIEGALNYNDKDLLANELFEGSPCPPSTLIILHCEYSVHRAPRAAKFVRQYDRRANDFRYPKLSFPEVYILDGGYSAFFSEYKTRCQPQQYVGMSDKGHEDACEKGMSKVRQQRAKLNRAQTFAFGEHNQLEDSPVPSSRFTVPTLGSLGMASDTSLILESPSDLRRGHTRRMVSY